jgi:hypothetical protein
VEAVAGLFEIASARGRGSVIRATVPAGRLPSAADAQPAAPARTPLAVVSN